MEFNIDPKKTKHFKIFDLDIYKHHMQLFSFLADTEKVIFIPVSPHSIEQIWITAGDVPAYELNVKEINLTTNSAIYYEDLNFHFTYNIYTVSVGVQNWMACMGSYSTSALPVRSTYLLHKVLWRLVVMKYLYHTFAFLPLTSALFIL